MKEISEEDLSFTELVNGAIEEYETSSPEEQKLFRRKMAFLTAVRGLIELDPSQGEQDPAKSAVIQAHIEIRRLAFEFKNNNPTLTNLELLRSYYEFVVDGYENLVSDFPEYANNLEAAKITRAIVNNAADVDEDLAQEVLEFVEL